MQEQKQQIYGFDDFRLDVPNRQLLRDGRSVPLPAKAFDMLVVLIENTGRLLSKDELFSRVWPDQIVEESNLTVQVSAIRRALGERRDRPRYVLTVPGHGYRFAGELLRPDAEEEELLIEHHTVTRVTVETEDGGVAAGSAIELAAPYLLPGGNGAGAVTFAPTAAHGAGALSAGALSPAAPPAVPQTGARAGRTRARFRAGVGAALVVAMLAAVFGLYRRAQHQSPAAHFQEITFKRLTNNRTVREAALSPDGKLFAYTYTADKEWRRSLWVGHVDGGEPILLRPPGADTYRSLNFAPDSSRLYFVLTNSDYPRGALFRVPVFGGAAEKVREGVRTKISFSPDMKQFAGVLTDEARGESALAVFGADGGEPRRLSVRTLARPFVASSPAWSPDGARIALGATSDEGGEANHEVFVVTAADGRTAQLTKRNFSFIRNLVWLRDGSGLVLSAIAYPQADAQLWHVSFPGGEVRRINPDQYDYSYSIDLSADGDSLLAIQTQTLTNIWVAPADDLSQARRVTFGSVGRREGLHGLEWTPEGRVAFPATEDGSEMLWEMSADGGGQKQLTSAGHVDNDLSMTADGGFIVFESNRGGDTEIWRADGDGGRLLQLTTGGANVQPSVSPDGRWVVYVSTRDRLTTLWRVPASGGEPVRLSDRSAGWPRVSPDGKLIACEYSAPDGPGHTKLALIPIDGGPPVKLFDVPDSANFRYGTRWTPDGAAVTYRDWFNGIWRQPLAGGAPQRLAGLPEEKLYAYGWSRDARQFAFTRGAEIRDVVLIRDLR
ncbi:MAG: winged helix-turn-helix domain-containing protein [Pyrinomonadaceae bacterium]